MKVETRKPAAVAAAKKPQPKPEAKPVSTEVAKKSAAAKFSRDEMSFGIGKALKLPPDIKKGSLAERIKTLIGGGVKDLGELFAHLHDLRVARGLKTAISAELDGVKLSRPLPASEAPHRGKDGRMYAPNGDPLIEVKISSKSYGTAETSSSRTAYVNPKTNEYYVVDKHGTIGPSISTAYGPMPLPAGSRFEDNSFSPWELRQLETAANGKFPNFPGLPTFPIPRDPPFPFPGKPPIWRDPGFVPQGPRKPQWEDPGFAPKAKK